MKLKIGNKEFDFFNDVNVTISYNSVASTFGFSVFYDPENAEHRQIFKPLSYAKAKVIFDGETLINGVILSHGGSSKSVAEMSSISGYSLTGVLEDSNIPLSVYPLQSDSLTLKELAEKLLKPFGLSMVISDSVKKELDSKYTSTDATATTSVKSYLSELASQKGVILSHTANGALLFTKLKADQKPIADLSGALEKTISVNGQSLHSEISVVAEAKLDGGNSSEETVKNAFIPVFRPKTVVQNSGDDNQTKVSADKLIADELRAVKLTITLNSWLIDGKIAKPSNIISVKDPSIFLNKTSNWFIESVNFTGNNKIQTCSLICCLPEVYNGQKPKNPFQ